MSNACFENQNYFHAGMYTITYVSGAYQEDNTGGPTANTWLVNGPIGSSGSQYQLVYSTDDGGTTLDLPKSSSYTTSQALAETQYRPIVNAFGSSTDNSFRIYHTGGSIYIQFTATNAANNGNGAPNPTWSITPCNNTTVQCNTGQGPIQLPNGTWTCQPCPSAFSWFYMTETDMGNHYWFRVAGPTNPIATWRMQYRFDGGAWITYGLDDGYHGGNPELPTGVTPWTTDAIPVPYGVTQVETRIRWDSGLGGPFPTPWSCDIKGDVFPTSTTSTTSLTDKFPPPAPVIENVDDIMTVESSYSDNTGGAIQLWYTEDINALGFQPVTANAWVEAWGVGPITQDIDGSLNPGWYKARVTGNGINYVGDSLFSNEFYIGDTIYPPSQCINDGETNTLDVTDWSYPFNGVNMGSFGAGMYRIDYVGGAFRLGDSGGPFQYGWLVNYANYKIHYQYPANNDAYMQLPSSPYISTHTPGGHYATEQEAVDNYRTRWELTYPNGGAWFYHAGGNIYLEWHSNDPTYNTTNTKPVFAIYPCDGSIRNCPAFSIPTRQMDGSWTCEYSNDKCICDPSITYSYDRKDFYLTNNPSWPYWNVPAGNYHLLYMSGAYVKSNDNWSTSYYTVNQANYKLHYFDSTYNYASVDLPDGRGILSGQYTENPDQPTAEIEYRQIWGNATGGTLDFYHSGGPLYLTFEDPHAMYDGAYWRQPGLTLPTFLLEPCPGCQGTVSPCPPGTISVFNEIDCSWSCQPAPPTTSSTTYTTLLPCCRGDQTVSSDCYHGGGDGIYCGGVCACLASLGNGASGTIVSPALGCLSVYWLDFTYCGAVWTPSYGIVRCPMGRVYTVSLYRCETESMCAFYTIGLAPSIYV